MDPFVHLPKNLSVRKIIKEPELERNIELNDRFPEIGSHLVPVKTLIISIIFVDFIKTGIKVVH